MAWATAGSVPIAGAPSPIPPSPNEPMQAAAPAEAPAQAEPAPQAEAAPTAAPAQAAQAAQAAPAEAQPAATAPSGPPDAQTVFPDHVISEFKNHVEQAINVGMPAEAFASRFVGAQPEGAMTLIHYYKADDFVTRIAAMPGGAESAITRRDGKKWVDKLWAAIPVAYEAGQKAAAAAQQAPAVAPS